MYSLLFTFSYLCQFISLNFQRLFEAAQKMGHNYVKIIEDYS